MNNDLISRKRLKNTILLGNYDTRSKILSAIDNAPTVLERPQGHWICEDVLHCLYYCSNCRTNGEHIQPFCAWCGADMRGANNGKEETT